MDPVSGFFIPLDSGDASPEASLERLSTHPQAFTELWRGSRHGRFRVWKCLREEYRGRPVYEGMLRKEFEIGYPLHHPHIAEYYDFLTLPGLGHCIEMEWIDGTPLTAGSREENRRHARELCDALSYLHAKQIVHKDLKPDNVLVTHHGGHVKLIDFGLADADDSLIRLQAGTAGYAAPEVVAGQPADHRSDIYSLGCILQELGFRRLGRRCCRPRPEDRPDSVERVRAALERRFPWMAVFLLALALLVLFLLVRQQGTPTPGPLPPADTTAAPVPETPAEPAGSLLPPASVERPAAPQPADTSPAAASSPDADREALEEIFRQATDLFE